MEENQVTQETNETEVSNIELTDTVETTRTEESNVVKEDKPAKKEWSKEEQAEIEDIVKGRVGREKYKYERKIAELQSLYDIAKVGMGKESADVREIEKEMRAFYKEQGVDIPERPYFSERDEAILAKADAQEIIEAGEDEMNRTISEITSKAQSQWSKREKTVFDEISKKLTLTKTATELEKKGIKSDILYDPDFAKFASGFNADKPVLEIYEIYFKLNNQVVEKPASTGSVKSAPDNDAVKDFYTYEESLKFTKRDLDKNPKLMKALENSMTKW